MNTITTQSLKFILTGITLFGCKNQNSPLSKQAIADLHLKTGKIISCGSPGKEFGTVHFDISGNEKLKEAFNTSVALLHSFEYDEAEKSFAAIIEEFPNFAMAYWGIAMCNFHPLWEPPTEKDLIKGSKAIGIAVSIANKSEHESGYINSVAAYYQNWNSTDPRTRAINFEKSMQALHEKYPEDKEAAIFYALALDASADPTDKLYVNQKKAGAILDSLYKSDPNHPGIIHYIIHNYDYPGIANLALPAAKRYASVAPSSAHALHMPSHIFTRLGMWDDCINSNIQSVSSAQCYAESAGIKGHWDEELHSLDYLIYAYLQQGNNSAAKQRLEYLDSIRFVYPANFKVAYTFAAAPARYALENKNWQEASRLTLHRANFQWNQFPWQEAIIHFARLLGNAHLGKMKDAQSELKRLNELHDTLQNQNQLYQATQVAIQIDAGEAWIRFYTSNKEESIQRMRTAADLEDNTAKHPVTPGEVIPARELYADMLFQMNQYDAALQAYEAVLQKSPNRFNSLYGAALTSQKLGRLDNALQYYRQLDENAYTQSERRELSLTKSYLKKNFQKIMTNSL